MSVRQIGGRMIRAGTLPAVHVKTPTTVAVTPPPHATVSTSRFLALAVACVPLWSLEFRRPAAHPGRLSQSLGYGAPWLRAYSFVV